MTSLNESSGGFYTILNPTQSRDFMSKEQLRKWFLGSLPILSTNSEGGPCQNSIEKSQDREKNIKANRPLISPVDGNLTPYFSVPKGTEGAKKLKRGSQSGSGIKDLLTFDRRKFIENQYFWETKLISKSNRFVQKCQKMGQNTAELSNIDQNGL